MSCGVAEITSPAGAKLPKKLANSFFRTDFYFI